MFICVLAFSSFVCVFIWAGPRPTLFSRLGSCLPLFVCFPMHYALLLDQDFRCQIHFLNKYKYVSEANSNIHLEKIQIRLPMFVCFPVHYALLLDQDFRIHTLNKYKYISKANTNIYLEEIQTRLPLFVCFPMHSALVLDQDSLSVHTIALTSSLLCTIENSQSMSK